MVGGYFYAKIHRFVNVKTNDTIFAIFALACFAMYFAMAMIAIIRQWKKKAILTKSILVVNEFVLTDR